MPQYSLGEYTTRIAALIRNGQIEEAIAHARHIVSHYPRYLPAYSLLARASMEKGDLSHASDFYQSILSANPEDADAWMNLAQLADDLGETEQAVWYMERAFEIEPGNSRVRERLRQLYSQRDGMERTRIKLTPAALARTQARSGSFRRASQKLQRILSTSTNLPPLQTATLEVALATALWNQKVKPTLADEICGSLLQKLPMCLQANLIRAQIYASTGRAQDAEPYLNTARELDPEGEFAFRLLGPQSPLPRTRVEVPYLDYQPAQAEPQPAPAVEPEEASWLDEVDEEMLDLAEQLPDQASDTAAAPEPEGVEIETATFEEAEAEFEPVQPAQPGPVAETAAPVPEWLRQIQQETTQETDQEDLDWLQEPETQAPEEDLLDTGPLHPPQEEIPDWLEGLRAMPEEPESEPSEPEPPRVAESTRVEEPTVVSQVPDWLLDLGQRPDEEVSEPGEPEPQADDSGLQTQPLSGVLDRGQIAAPEGPPPQAQASLPEPEEERGVPDWLLELDQSTEDLSAPESDQAAPAAPLETEPVEPVLEQQPEAERRPSSLEDLGLSDAPNRPAWLQELQAEVLGTRAAAEPAEPPAPTLEPTTEQAGTEPYEWLAELGVTDVPSEQEDELGTGPLAPMPEPEPILEPVQEEEPPALDVADVPSKQKDELGTGPLAPVPEPEPALEPTPDEELPAWLLELREPTGDKAAETEAPTEDEIVVPLEQPEPEPAAAPSLDTPLEEPEELEPEEALPDWLQAFETEPEPEAEAAPAGDLEVEEAIPGAAETEALAGDKFVAPLEQPEPEPTTAPALDTQLREPEEPEPEEALPDWLQAFETEPEAETAPAGGMEAEEAPEWLSEPEEEPLPTVTVDEMPDWLGHLQEAEETPTEEPAPAPTEAEQPEPATSIEDLEWLQELETAPEPITEAQPEPPLDRELPGPVGETEIDAEPAVAEVPVVAEAPAAPAPIAPLDDARQLLDEGTLDAAAQQYEAFLALGDVQQDLVTELDEAVETHPEHSGLQRVLGDAYMRSNQLEQALDAYRKALSKL